MRRADSFASASVRAQARRAAPGAASPSSTTGDCALRRARLVTPKLLGDVVAAHHAHHLATDLLLDDRPPGDQAEAQPVVDHGETAAGQLCRAQKLAAHRLPFLDGLEGKTPLGRQLPADT